MKMTIPQTGENARNSAYLSKKTSVKQRHTAFVIKGLKAG